MADARTRGPRADADAALRALPGVEDGPVGVTGYCMGARVATIAAGIDQGVEWCVAGLDRNWAYNPSCKAARP